MVDSFRWERILLRYEAGQIPILGFGTLIADPEATKIATGDALEAGFRHFDCAERYRNEREVGEALRIGLAGGNITRDELFVTTKVWNTNHRPERVRPAFDGSLERLGLDYLDLYLIHTPFAFKPGADQDPRAAAVDDGQQLQGGRRDAAFAVAVAQRKLHPFIVQLALDAKPFLPQAALGQGRCEKPERLGRAAGRLRRCVQIHRGGPELSRRPEPGKAHEYDGAPSLRAAEKPHLTPLVRASARPVGLLVTGSFRRGEDARRGFYSA